MRVQLQRQPSFGINSFCFLIFARPATRWILSGLRQIPQNKGTLPRFRAEGITVGPITDGCDSHRKGAGPQNTLGHFTNGAAGESPSRPRSMQGNGSKAKCTTVSKAPKCNHLRNCLGKARSGSTKARVVHRFLRRHPESAVASSKSREKFGSSTPAAFRSFRLLPSPVRWHASRSARYEHRFGEVPRVPYRKIQGQGGPFSDRHGVHQLS